MLSKGCLGINVNVYDPQLHKIELASVDSLS